MKQKQLFSALKWITLAAAIGAMMLLLSNIGLYSDDYQYSVFFKGGMASFWKKTVEHYTTLNGRALVHFVAEVFLLFGTKLYMHLFPVLMAVIFSLGNILQRGCLKGTSAGAAAVSICLMLALPVEYLNQTLCWIAGSFNYCFPALLLFGYFALMQRAVRGRRLVWACVLGFLAGATTEQYGLMAILGGGLMAAISLLRSPADKRRWINLAPVGASLVGYLTVMLAPGTANRIGLGGETVGTLSILFDPKAFGVRFGAVMNGFSGSDTEYASASFLLTALMVMLSLLPLVRRKKILIPLAAGLPCAVFYYWMLSIKAAPAAQWCVLIYFAMAGILLLFDRRFTMSGILLLCGLASMCIMIFTNLSSYYRTAMPTLILFIVVLVRLGQFYLLRTTQAAHLAAGAAAITLSVLAMIPTFQGYAYNKEFIDLNDAAVMLGEKQGEITLYTDFAPKYRHTMMYENMYLFNYFKQCYDIAEDMPVNLEGEQYLHFPVILDDVLIDYQCMMTSGALYMPMVKFFALYDYTCSWDSVTGDGFYLTRDDEQVYLSRQDRCIRSVDGKKVLVDESYAISILGTDYIDLKSAAAFVGADFVFDWNTVTITSKNISKNQGK